MVMAFDPHHSQVVLFGGLNFNADEFYNETWSWNGTTWTQINTPHQPPPVVSASMVFDAARGEMVLFGGGNTYDENFYPKWHLDSRRAVRAGRHDSWRRHRQPLHLHAE